ncbi:MAG: hypothetical protein HUU38_25325 [Anaerolineales bacterium]|nr:hypothetical protein [Anaerolineales bacterium]
MNLLANPYALYALIALAYFSLTDLRDRTAPGIELFFGGAVLLGVLENPLRVGVVVLVVVGILKNWRPLVLMALFVFPSTWVVVWGGYLYHKKAVGGADWLALAGLACLFPWYVPVFAGGGMVLWHAGWRGRSPVPALPGIWLGTLIGLMWFCFF